MDDWFQKGLRRRLGKGNKIKFWEDVWLGNLSLKEIFPRLYNMSECKDKFIEELGEWVRENWEWSLSWRRLVGRKIWLLNLVLTAHLDRETDDRWIWFVDDSKNYTSNSAYKLLLSSCAPSEPVLGLDNHIFKHFWKSKAPTKVLAFSWQVLLNRLPTKTNLFTRNVLNDNEQLSCVICGANTESAEHLFLSCPYVSQIWRKIYAWLGHHLVVPSNVVDLFLQLGGIFTGRQSKEGT